MTVPPCPYAPCPRCQAEVDDRIPARMADLRAEYDQASGRRAETIRAEHATLQARRDALRATAGPGTAGRTAMDEPGRAFTAAPRPAEPVEIRPRTRRRRVAL